MLDEILYASAPSLDLFRTIHGLTALVTRIHLEVSLCLEMECQFKQEEFLPSYVPDPNISPKFRQLYIRTPLLRALMKLILHMMQSSGTVDGMRNLVDSSLPGSILTIFKHSRLFGAVGIFGLAINVMSTFVHNEPTSLSILQELGLPSAFLKAANDVTPASPEVISAFPNAFGAICLNETGLALFLESNPIDNFLSVFTNEVYLKVLFDNDVPHLVGNSMDELMRHHPSTKEKLMESVVSVVKNVVALGKTINGNGKDGCFLHVSGMKNEVATGQVIPGTDVLFELNDEGHLSQIIGVMAAVNIYLISSFLKGYFRTYHTVKILSNLADSATSWTYILFTHFLTTLQLHLRLPLYHF